MDQVSVGRAYRMSLASLVMTVFGFFWLGWAVTVSGRNPAVAWPALYGVFIALVGASIYTIRKGNARAAFTAAPDSSWRLVRGRFHVITGMEAGGCALAVALALVWHRPELVALGISLVVGLHFLPLARLFRVRIYYLVGRAIVLCDLLGWVFLRSTAITASVGVTTGLILWIVAIYALLQSRRRPVPEHADPARRL